MEVANPGVIVPGRPDIPPPYGVEKPPRFYGGGGGGRVNNILSRLQPSSPVALCPASCG